MFRGAAVGLGFSSMMLLGVGAEARTPEACQQAWSQAVRSYLTQNRTRAPGGQQLDDPEEVDQAWLRSFKSACQKSGPRASRAAAATRGLEVLQKLDRRGCARFAEFYLGLKAPEQWCQGPVENAALSAALPRKSRS